MQAEIASKNCKQKLQAEIASRNCKQKLQAEIVSRNCKAKIASRNCKQKLQAEIASRNCTQKLQVSFEFKTRFNNQPATRFEFSKKEKFEKHQKIIYYQKISPKIPEFFPSKSWKTSKICKKNYK